MAEPRRPKTVYVYGDAENSRLFLKGLKRAWHGQDSIDSEWVEIDGAEKGALDRFLDLVSCPPLNELPRTVVFKAPPDNETARSAIKSLVTDVPDCTTLVVWDSEGLSANTKKKSHKGWVDIRSACKNNGEVHFAGKEFSSMKTDEQLSIVSGMSKSKGVQLPKDCAVALLERCGGDLSVINGELDSLAMVADGPVTLDLIESMVVPVAGDYAIYLFQSAFNKGKYAGCMASAFELSSRGIPYDVMMSMAVRQARWHVVAAFAQASGGSFEAVMERCKPGEQQHSRSRLWKDRSLSRRMFADISDGDSAPKKESVPSFYAMGDIKQFVSRTFPSAIPGNDSSKKSVVLEAMMRRYLILVESLKEVRSARTAEKESVFARSMRRILL